MDPNSGKLSNPLSDEQIASYNSNIGYQKLLHYVQGHSNIVPTPEDIENMDLQTLFKAPPIAIRMNIKNFMTIIAAELTDTLQRFQAKVDHEGFTVGEIAILKFFVNEKIKEIARILQAVP